MAQEVIGLRVSGLTSAERDSIALQHSDPEGLHVIYACVPAGIIVFATGQHEGTRANLRAHVAQAMAPVVPESRINPGELSLQAAESACKAAREQ